MQYDFSLRQKCIIHYLSSRNDYCSGNELASVAHVSARTIRKEIKDINILLDKLDHTDGFFIEAVHSKGYRFKIMDRTAFEEFIHDFDYDSNALERRLWDFIERQIRLLTVMCDHLDLDMLEDIIHYSESVIRPVIRNMEVIRDPREKLSVVLDGNNLCAKGEEYFIRIRAMDVIFIDPSYKDATADALAYLKNEEFEAQVRACMIEEFSEEPVYSIGELAIEYAVQFLWVSHVRNHMGYFLAFQEDNIRLISEYAGPLALARRVVENIYQKAPYRFTREDTYALALIFTCVCDFKDIERMYMNEKSEALCGHMVSFIIDDLDLEEEDTERVTNALRPFCYSFYLRDHFRISRPYMGLTRIKRKLISAVEYSRRLSREIECYSGTSASEKEIIHLALCIASIQNLFNEKSGQRILVSSKFGLLEGRRFAASLERVYGRHISEVKVVESYEIEAYRNVFDWVFVDDSQKKNLSGEEDNVRVYPEYSTASALPQDIVNDIKKLKDKFYFMRLFQEDSFVTISANSKKEVFACIEHMVNLIYDIKAPVAASLAEEDRRLTYECGYRTALIHVKRAEIREEKIRIGILEQPVVWRKRLVQLVIIIFTGEDYRLLWQFEHGLRALMQTSTNSSLLANKPSFETLQKIFEEGNK